MAKRKRYRRNQHWWKHRIGQIFFLATLGVLTIISPVPLDTGEVLSSTTDERIQSISSYPRTAYPVKTQETPLPTLSAKAIYAIDVPSGVQIVASNERQRMLPASITKVLTAIVALELYGTDTVISVPESTVSGQLMDLVVGDRLTAEQLLYGMLIQSGNDAAYALAAHAPGGYEAFVSMMNAKARELLLTDSSFTNPIGYDDPNHYMTARDIARLGRIAIQDRRIAKIVSIPNMTIPNADYTHFYPLRNINELLGQIPGMAGIKTGWTEGAGENLLSLVERDGKRIIIVVLGSTDRFADTEALVSWIFDNTTWMQVEPVTVGN